MEEATVPKKYNPLKYIISEYWKKKGRLLDFPKRNAALGPGCTLLMAFIIESLYMLNITTINLTGLFSLTVIYSAFIGSFEIGLISVFISTVYSTYYLLTKLPSNHFHLEYNYLFFHVIILLAINLMMGMLKDKLMITKSELAMNQESMKKVENISNIMIIESDLNGRVSRVPKQFSQFLGYTDQELLSLKDVDITHPEDFAADEEKIKDLIAGKHQFFESEKRYMKKDGTSIWVYINMFLIRENNGIPLSLMAYVKDINSYKTATMKLRESEEKLRRITENMIDMICQTDDRGEIVYVSPSSRKVLGYEPEELMHHSIFEWVFPDDLNLIKNTFHDTLKHSGPGKVETRYKHKLGHYIWLEVLGNVILSDSSQVIGTILSCRDISNRKLTENALKESENRYRSLVEMSPDAIIVHQKGKYVFANQAAMNLVGISDPDELIGRNILDFLHEDYHKIALERSRNVLKGIAVPLMEEKVVRQDKSIVDVEVSVIPFEFEGKMAIQAVIRDISDRKRAEDLMLGMIKKEEKLNEAMEYDRIKTEFFSNISHELRTPLNVILGTLQLFKYYINDEYIITKNPNIMKHTQVMKQNCLRLLRLVNNLIDITKIDAGFYDLNLGNCDLVALTRDISESVMTYFESKELSLTFETSSDEIRTAVDPDKIERIILNLLSNAVKFSKTGGKVRVILEEINAQVIRITVEDTGIGIPEDKMAMLFKRFQQVDKSLTRNHEGSGIGLSLVKSLVDMHGGAVWVESQYGVGSSFIIEIPRQFKEHKNSPHYINEGTNRIEKIHVEFSDIYS